ncbi:hypothetical protein N5P32_09900 [Marinomonas pontica]|uniref:DedA family protein n=1 Tax=Marinomonas pontica TaxID=264739 RepID=UPI002243BD8D|nr:VTT domain-containing protein [Marinomonas pontica]MCW8356193.1 hypothetical protein [Marinomonas pontica]
MIAELQAWLTSGNTSLTLLCVGIVLLSYLLEDLAIATAATVSVQGHLSPSLALLSIFIGIASGDVGLYLLGRYARNVRWLRYRALTHTSFNVVREKLTQRAFANLFLIRFIPGLRTIGFTLSGFFYPTPAVYERRSAGDVPMDVGGVYVDISARKRCVFCLGRMEVGGDPLGLCFVVFDESFSDTVFHTR